MNRHLYGPEHGIPLHQIETGVRTDHFRREIYGKYGVDWDNSWRARDELLISGEYIMSHRQGDAKALLGFLSVYYQPVCAHMCLSYGSSSWATHTYWIPELFMGMSSPDCFRPCAGAVRSCPSCITDVDVYIEWQGDGSGTGSKSHRKGWVVKAVLYCRIG